MKLDRYQKQAVVTNENILLIAGAGAGKTFTITQKINYIVTHNICLPEEILLISFTNKSVDDLKSKIKYNCDILTFHKLAINILNDYNISYNIANKDYLDLTVNEFFYSLSDEKLINDILKIYPEWNYENFLKSYKFLKLKELIIRIIRTSKSCDSKISDFEKLYNKNNFLTKLILIIKIIYEDEMKSSNLLDYDDLIIKATKVVNKFYKYKYIIVDEFQDTSLIRFNLINKLRKLNNAKFFAVGDDYQAIYHFSGCSTSLFWNIKDYIPNIKILKLKNVYRNSQELIDICARFISKNSQQIKKELLSQKHNNPIKIIYYINPYKAFNKLYKKITKISDDVLVLGRNNNDIKYFSKDPKIPFLTVHSAKGLEADNVIIINLTNSTFGFPNKLDNNYLLEMLHPSDKSYLFAEERRLFYVALTRTKNQVYLLVPFLGRSIFVNEIKSLLRNIS